MSGEKEQQKERVVHAPSKRYRNLNFLQSKGFGQTSFYPQKHGGPVELVLYATEGYTLFEDKRGYSAVYDAHRGVWCYARLNPEGHFYPDVPLSQSPPEDLQPKLRESNRYLHSKLEELATLRDVEKSGLLALEKEVSPPEGDRTFGPDNGLLEGPKIFDGPVKGLTILVEFADETFESTLGVSGSALAKKVESLLNEPKGYKENGNFCSVREFYSIMSNGALDYTNQVLGPITLEGEKWEYVSSRDIVGEVLQALQEFEDKGLVSPLDLDYKNRRLVSALNILYAGEAVFKGTLWPHNSAYLDDQTGQPAFTFQKSKMRVYYYLLTDLSELVIGTICHENGHLLFRFPDLYTYGDRDGENQPKGSSSGIGRYCLMGAGNYNNRRRAPCAVSGYLRELAGWVKKVVILNNFGGKDITIPHGDFTTIHKWKISENEYFIVENRLSDGLDAYLPSNGLAVFHCDRKGSNEWWEGTARQHFQLALLQADGSQDLEHGTNAGDVNDMFRPGKSLTDSTKPNTRAWGNIPSGLAITDIRFNADKSITFRLGAGKPQPSRPGIGGGSFSAVAAPVLITKDHRPADPVIPDNWPLGITDSIKVDDSGVCRQVIVSVNILHNRVEDLYVALSGPSGQKVILHNRVVTGTPNLNKQWDVSKSFTTESAKGFWVLEVSDNATAEDGYLHNWGLQLLVSKN